MKGTLAVGLLCTLAAVAGAERTPIVSIHVTATATTAMPKHAAWRAIGQVAADRYGWCLEKGGVGESITFTFDDALPIDELQIVAGYGPEWQDKNRDAEYGRPDRIEIKTDKQTFESPLERAEPDKIALSGAPIRSVTLKILSVKAGKVAPTCVNRVQFISKKVEYRSVYGMDARAFADLPRFATALDAAFKTCDANVLRTAIAYPLKHDHEFTSSNLGDQDIPGAKKSTYRTVEALVAACRQPDSVLSLGLAGPIGRDAVDVADDIKHPFSETNNEVHIGDWSSHAWWLTTVDGSWKLSRVLTSEDVTVDPRSEIQEMATAQHKDPDLFTADAKIVLVQTKVGTVKPAEAIAQLAGKPHKESDISVTFARDRRTAVLSFVEKVEGREYRVSEVVVREADAWKIASGMWSEAKANPAVNKAAQGKTIAPFVRIAPPGTGSTGPLADAFVALQTGPLDAVAAARKDLVVFGSGPGERTFGGAKLAKPWLAAWAKHIALDESGLVTKLVSTGATGWVVADVLLDKKSGTASYRIPFRMYFVFDKTVDGTWTLLHAHIATVAP